ncbi:hypothetical protein FE257_004710 [Aspergillus nanangensis]|uniref:Uncharacterized protein n=1 Tax=Aspergillus nanangensis TaxID=2582783 RepID=A0AAD4CYI8_ASPNN|nr:hypothetical protein FE257_004710 [Aspergillus nanangensis]
MSSTETTTTRTQGNLAILTDYELHHSGSREPEAVVSSSSTVPQTQPLNWTSNHRRVPAYRPINRNLDRTERPAGSNAGEFLFIQAMLHGVWLNASVAQFWRATGGRLNDGIFRKDVGGEW